MYIAVILLFSIIKALYDKARPFSSKALRMKASYKIEKFNSVD